MIIKIQWFNGIPQGSLKKSKWCKKCPGSQEDMSGSVIQNTINVQFMDLASTCYIVSLQDEGHTEGCMKMWNGRASTSKCDGEFPFSDGGHTCLTCHRTSHLCPTPRPSAAALCLHFRSRSASSNGDSWIWSTWSACSYCHTTVWRSPLCAPLDHPSSPRPCTLTPRDGPCICAVGSSPGRGWGVSWFCQPVIKNILLDLVLKMTSHGVVAYQFMNGQQGVRDDLWVLFKAR